jgi:hypothetical protein
MDGWMNGRKCFASVELSGKDEAKFELHMGYTTLLSFC